MTPRSATPGPRGLSEDQIAGEPMAQFARWMDDALASGMPEPTAMVLSSITAEGGPRARTVLLKAHDQAGFTFYSNRTSRKGRELTGNPSACLVFPWYGIERQVIVEGKVRELSQAESEPYYRSRPRLSQIGAWASRQSTVIASPSWSGAGRNRGRCRCLISGAGTSSNPTRWSSGRRARSGCMTGCATGVPTGAGPSIACPPDAACSVLRTASAARSAPSPAVVTAVLASAA